MTNEYSNELQGRVKKLPELPIPMSNKAHRNLIELQGQYQIKYKKRINLKALGNRIFEKATSEVL